MASCSGMATADSLYWQCSGMSFILRQWHCTSKQCLWCIAIPSHPYAELQIVMSNSSSLPQTLSSHINVYVLYSQYVAYFVYCVCAKMRVLPNVSAWDCVYRIISGTNKTAIYLDGAGTLNGSQWR